MNPLIGPVKKALGNARLSAGAACLLLVSLAVSLALSAVAALAVTLPFQARAQAKTTATASAPSTAPTILVYGDSLSAEYGIARGSGWAALLERRLVAEKFPHRVINSSISGETTSGGASRIAGELATHKPAIVILELGGNDALRGLAPAMTRQNFKTMIEASTKAGAKVVLAGMQMPPNYGRAFTEQFKVMYSELAREYKAALVPHFLEGVGEKRELFQSDGIHPLASAHPLILDNVWPVLKPVLQAPGKSATAKR